MYSLIWLDSKGLHRPVGPFASLGDSMFIEVIYIHIYILFPLVRFQKSLIAYWPVCFAKGFYLKFILLETPELAIVVDDASKKNSKATAG